MLNRRYDLLVGLEIETAYRVGKIPVFHEGGYHDDERNYITSSFFAESDSSLSTSSGYGGHTEFISDPFLLKDLKETILELKEWVGHKDLVECFDFNDSCGAHVHMGLIDTQASGFCNGTRDCDGFDEDFKGKFVNPRKVYSTKFLETFREELFKEVRANYPSIAENWIEHYDREYAPKWQGHHYRERGEFNFGYNDRMEFRAFSLLGIQTWEDMIGMYQLMLNTFKMLFLKEIRKSNPFNVTQEIGGEYKAPENKVKRFYRKTKLPQLVVNEDNIQEGTILSGEDLYRREANPYSSGSMSYERWQREHDSTTWRSI